MLLQLDVMTFGVSVSEIESYLALSRGGAACRYSTESYLAVMRLINVTLPVLTEWTQGTGVAS